MKKAFLNKAGIGFLFLIVVSLLAGCGSKQPNVAGLWEVDFWNDASIRLNPDLKFFVYADHDAVKNKDHYADGEYRLYEQDGLNCIGLGKFEGTIQDTAQVTTGLPGIIEYASDDHIILTLDERCNIWGWKVWDPGVGMEKLNLKRIE